jgi:hypothetical protein
LLNIDPTCTSTVFALKYMRWLIPALESPSAISVNTLHSRFVSRYSWPAGCDWMFRATAVVRRFEGSVSMLDLIASTTVCRAFIGIDPF